MPRPARTTTITLLALACASSALVACKHKPAKAPLPRTPAASHVVQIKPTSPVVVSIVIDQMAAWIAEERWPLLPKDGGFARLLREGTYAQDVRFAHAVTDTAPGHASLYTGASPRESGVFGNERPTALDARESLLLDDDEKLVSPSGIVEGSRGASLRILASGIETVADRLRVEHDDALVVSLSLKDRGAMFGGGKWPTASLWLDPKRDKLVTSTAVAAKFPEWAARLGDTEMLGVARRGAWKPLDVAFVKDHALTPDAQPGEGDLAGLGTTFPHTATSATAFRATPHADALLLALARAAIDTEHAGTRPTLIALSLSANDYIGHTFGPDSWEAWDELRRLDRSLAQFFGELDERFGADGWSAILSADHGVTTMPEAIAIARPWCAKGGTEKDRWGRACVPVARVMPDDLAKELAAVATKALGPAPKGSEWIDGVADPYVFFSSHAHGLPAGEKKKLLAALTTAIEKHPEVEKVYATASLPSQCPPDEDESIDALVCRSFSPGGGELYVVLKRGSFFDPSVVPGKGTSHGSPFLFDRAVPIVVRAPGRAQAGLVVKEPVSFRSFAKTLSSLLGVHPPERAERARDLTRSTP